MSYAKKIFATLGLIAVLANAVLAEISIAGYSYSNSPSSSYPDSGGELTNGVDSVVVWGQGVVNPPTAQLVGWLNRNTDITFNFTSQATVKSFTVWAADSDNYAGVGLPESISIRTADESFSRTFTVDNPAGNGNTIPLTFGGFEVTTDQLIVSFVRNYQWTMFSEVTFSAVPEPAHTGVLLGLAGLMLLAIRRRRNVA